MARKILVVDDEAVLVETIAYNLEQAGYRVVTAADGRSALDAARSEIPDLIILDIMLPGMDGLEVCRQLRRESGTATTPIVMLTAKDDEIDKVVGLEVGADDYVTKPFGRRELLARVRALLRRVDYPAPGEDNRAGQEAAQEVRPASRELVAGPLRIDLAGRRVNCRGQDLELQPKQFELLTYLVRNRGTVSRVISSCTTSGATITLVILAPSMSMYAGYVKSSKKIPRTPGSFKQYAESATSSAGDDENC